MGWVNELRLAARGLLRRPGFAAAAVLTLALGIGANIAIFTVVNAVLIQPLPYPESDRIVSIEHHAPGINLPDLNNSAGTLNFYWQEADFLSSLAGFDVQRRNLIGGPQPMQVQVVAVTPQIFDVLRVQPMMGRPFSAADATAGAPPSAVILTYDTWQNLLGGDRSALGRSLEIDGNVVEVVGVMPRGFHFPDPEIVALTPMYVDPNGSFGTFGTDALGRLADGVTVQAAAARLSDLQVRLPDFVEGVDAGFLEGIGWSASLKTYRDELVGSTEAALWIVLGTMAFVLLIACANVANLFLVRAEARQKELAIRAAMGAGRGRIAAGFLTEALTLGAAGGVVGMGLAWLGVDALVATSPDGLPRLHEVAIDGWVLCFAALLSVVAGLAFGAVPLLRHGRIGLGGLLKDGGRANTAGRERHRTRNVLVASQLGLALVLLVGSTLMLKSFQRLSSLDLGIDPGNVTNIGLSLGDGVERGEAALFYSRVADEVAALPGVTRTGLSSAIPLGTGNWNGGSFNIRSRPRGEDEIPPVAMFKAVDEGYLEIMGMRLEEGRNLTRADWQGGAPVILVNRTFADAFLEGDALGEGIHWSSMAGSDAFAEVVGVVPDVREMGREEEQRAMGYLPMMVGDWPGPELQSIYLLVESPEGVDAPVDAIREIVYRLNPNVPLTTVETMEQVMSDSMADTTFTLALLGIASVVALLLGAIGLFGVISYVVGQRTREIGVRVALGARSGEIQAMVLRQGAGVAVAGILVGLAGAFGMTRVMGAVLFEVSATDPWAFAVPPIVLLAVAAGATWLPARRASRVEPVEALRSD